MESRCLPLRNRFCPQPLRAPGTNCVMGGAGAIAPAAAAHELVYRWARIRGRNPSRVGLRSDNLRGPRSRTMVEQHRSFALLSGAAQRAPCRRWPPGGSTATAVAVAVSELPLIVPFVQAQSLAIPVCVKARKSGGEKRRPPAPAQPPPGLDLDG